MLGDAKAYIFLNHSLFRESTLCARMSPSRKGVRDYFYSCQNFYKNLRNVHRDL